MQLLNLRQLSITLGNKTLLQEANLQINSGEHLCLIGRNGVGKSTLLKLITGKIEADSGSIECKPELTTSYLSQEVPRDLTGDVYSVVASGLGKTGELLQQYEALNQKLQTNYSDALITQIEKLQQEIEFHNAWKSQQQIESVISQMDLPAHVEVSSLSGGLTRRVLLAKALVCDPDILILDEPTNHLDITAILWLEKFLANYRKTLLFVSHDRAFMQAVASRFVEIDNCQITSFPGNYTEYLKQKQALQDALEKEQTLFDKKLAQEEVWIRQGIKARRTRNEGRVRALKQMRQQRSERLDKIGKAKVETQAHQASGKIVFDVDHLSYTYHDEPIINDFSTVISRSDKIGIIGPNGSGKTTLINLLLKKLEPKQGAISHGTQLSIAYFDQYRHQLDETKTVQENVYPGDMIPIGNKSIHVISYLKNFLFSPERARTKVSVLSGGERNRLLLAKLFTQPSNLLVLDEPTNDLDIETLELLEEQLIEYQGTILLISHDRAFINNVVTSTLVLEGNGKVQEYVGGYDDWLRQRTEASSSKESQKTKKADKAKPSTKLSYKDQRELDQLPDEISALEAEIETLQQTVSSPEFYKKSETDINQTQQLLSELEKKLETRFSRWEELEGK